MNVSLDIEKEMYEAVASYSWPKVTVYFNTSVPLVWLKISFSGILGALNF